MSVPQQFHGWLGYDKTSVDGNMKWEAFTPKTLEPTDVDIKVTHCGICGTDIHTLSSGWGSTHYPCCVGHEIVGTAARVGPAVTTIKVGDRVGVGAQALACLKPDCEDCSAGLPQNCAKMVGTYNGKYPDGSWSMGGYSNYTRVPAAFVVKIPEKITSADAAPMLCGGVTVWTPLTKNGDIKGKNVGIVGVGGLGHFGVLFAKALGAAKVVAISRSGGKKEDALAMGATDFIATDEDVKWERAHSRTLDLIVSTVSSANMPLAGYMRLLRTNGQFIQVGAPEDELPPVPVFSLISKNCKFGGSQIGSPQDITDMLEFAAENGIKPWVQERKMSEANAAVKEMHAGKARYRLVLVNDNDHAKL